MLSLKHYNIIYTFSSNPAVRKYVWLDPPIVKKANKVIFFLGDHIDADVQISFS